MKTQPQPGKSLSSLLFLGAIFLANLLSGFGTPIPARAQSGAEPEAPPSRPAIFLPLVHSALATSRYPVSGSSSRGYLTTPAELAVIKGKADQRIEPYRSAYAAVMDEANKPWSYTLESTVTCPDSDSPDWLDNGGGVPILYSKALAYHLTREGRYAAEVKTILEKIMSQVKNISSDHACRLRFAWGTPELVASADLIEDYWKDKTCTGPASTLNADTSLASGNCKDLFQNWLVKNPYYFVSFSATDSQSNWGAAATNTTAYIADYLWDRPEVKLLHRNPDQVNGGRNYEHTPAQAFQYSKQLMLDRMNGFRVEYSSTSCDYLGGSQQSSQWAPVKSQITPNGVIPEDSRREQYCNIPPIQWRLPELSPAPYQQQHPAVRAAPTARRQLLL